MSKTMGDLRKAYKDGYRTKVDSYDYHPTPSSIVEAERAGIAAVVRALRDEFGRIMYPGDDWNRQGILEQFEEILGAAGDEAAGGPTREDGQASQGAASTPAAAPAPDVCVWLPHHQTGMGMLFVSKCDRELHFVTASGDCPSCGLPIKFTEESK